MIPFAPGDIVSGLEPNELVEIQKISGFGARTLVEAIGVDSRRQIKRPLSTEQMAVLTRVRGKDHTFLGAPDLFLLGAEAERIRIAHQFDPLFAVSSSIVDPLPHQIEAVYRYLLPLPRIRFLLADDTGAGKTIMTGLLIKELLFRGVIQKILIITPGGLTKQWAEEELLEKFGLHAKLVNRASFEAEPGQFARSDDGIFVTSIDFLARNEACLNAASDTQWDLIVVDEAHKLSAYEYGAKLEESERYRAVKALAGKTDHLLFLTATPHRGRKDTFRRLLMLLDEDLFQKDSHVSTRVLEQTRADSYGSGEEAFEGEQPISRARNRFFLRRLKEEMVDWEGKALFVDRETETVGYELTPEEKNLYDEVTRYVRSKRREAQAKKNRNVELTLMVMQRRLASSLYAITRTLENRLRALSEVLAILRDPTKTEAEKKRLLSGGADTSDPRNLDEYEDLTEEERARIDRKIFRQVLSNDPRQIEEERAEVDRLFRLAESLKNHKEAKFVQLLDVLDSSDIIRSDAEKLVIFTEHRDTLENLTKRLTDKGYTVATIHGGMDVDARKQAQRDFRLRAKIMVATDAAGEGINLQFCRHLINWDIPWNPNRLEQRMGRVHRYGQMESVRVFNLVASNTREGKVLERVLEKIDVMRDQMGEDRVYDVITDLLEDVPLVDLIEQALESDDETQVLVTTDAALATASQNRAEELIALQKKSSLASQLNLRAARELRDASDERRLQPLFVQRFFERAWAACGGTLRPDGRFPVWDLGLPPTALRELARERRISLRDSYDHPIVFDKQLVSVASRASVPERTRLLGPGHPLFDTLIAWAIRQAGEAFAKGTLLVDPNITTPQRVWLVRSTIQDGRVEARKRLAHEQLIVVTEDLDGASEMRATSPAALLNCLSPAEDPILPELPQTSTEDIQAWTYDQVTEKQREQVQAARTEECEVRRQYLLTAFSDLILDLQEDLNDLQQAELRGEENREEQAQLQARVEELKNRRTTRLAELELMLNLNANLPEVLTQAIIVPAASRALQAEEGERPSRGFPMRRDDEVERIAMETTMRYEEQRGWKPYDVSQDGEHYDIRSEGPEGEKRFIEVKGRAQSGPIVLTGPELDKLRQLADRAWLYVVTACKGEQPRLRVIQDPIPQLNPEMLYRQVQYLIDEADWSRQGQEATVQDTSALISPETESTDA